MSALLAGTAAVSGRFGWHDDRGVWMTKPGEGYGSSSTRLLPLNVPRVSRDKR